MKIDNVSGYGLLSLGILYFISQAKKVQSVGTVTSVTDQGTEVIEEFKTPVEGTQAINKAIQSGRTITKQSRTLASERDGETIRGIIKDDQGSLLGVTVKPVERNIDGLSYFDRLTLRNLQETIARGENPPIPNNLRPFLSDF